MNLFTGEASDEYFGGEVPPPMRELLQRAQAAASAADRTALLWTAQSCAPQALAVYYALYKHHTSLREFELAEKAALRGLAEAAEQAGLPDDRAVDGHDGFAFPTGPMPGVDFQRPGPARFWLFTQKALAFIALRSGRPKDARRRLALIERLDPQSRVGSDVIAALLASTDGDAGECPPSQRQ